jgi:hypothetical protein
MGGGAPSEVDTPSRQAYGERESTALAPKIEGGGRRAEYSGALGCAGRLVSENVAYMIAAVAGCWLDQ